MSTVIALDQGPTGTNTLNSGLIPGVVRFLVKFDQKVTNLDPGSFSLETTGGQSDAFIREVVEITPPGSTPQYSVHVQQGSGDGTVSLKYTGVLAEPTFTGADYSRIGGGPMQLAIGDVNGDRRPDIVTLNSSGTVMVAYNDPLHPGQFAQPVLLNVPSGVYQTYPGHLALADLNADGRMDIVTRSDTYQLGVMLSQPNGTFSGQKYTVTAGTDSTVGTLADVKIADVDRDGRPDIVSLNGLQLGSLDILHNNGDGTFTQSAHLNAPGGHITIADLNGDGANDILTTNDAGLNRIFYSQSGGSFSASADFNAGGGAPLEVAVGDFNHDGRQDIAELKGTGAMVVFTQTANGSFPSTATPIGDLKHPGGHMLVADLIGNNGKDDLVTINDAGSMGVLFANGLGGFTSPRPEGYKVTGGAKMSVAVGDVNGDGKQDVVTLGGAVNDVFVFYNNGKGTLAQAGPIVSTDGAVHAKSGHLQLADLNGDGTQDIVTINDAGQMSVMLANVPGKEIPVYTIDKTPPEISITYPEGAGEEGEPEIGVSGNIADDRAGNAWITLSGLVSDTHAYGSTVHIFDGGNEIGKTTVGITHSVGWTGIYVPPPGQPMPPLENWSLAVPISPGHHELFAWVVDPAGNNSSSASIFFNNTPGFTPPVMPPVHAPVLITSLGAGDSARTSVVENSVTAATVVAQAAGSGDAISYGIAGGEDAALFAIDAATGAVSFKAAPDFERPADQGGNNVYDLIVKASSSAGSTDTQVLAIEVTDANEPPAVAGMTLTGNGSANTLTGKDGNDTIVGKGGNDTLKGLAGNDKLDGGDGNDKLEGGAGNDMLAGGSGNDTYVFKSAGFGKDTITDFQVGSRSNHDTLDLRGLGFKSVADVLSHTDGGANAVIHVGVSDTILLQGVSFAQLQAHTYDFLLA